MKKILILVLLTVVTSACTALSPVSTPAPVIDSQATIAAMVQTSEAQTKAAQPSPTIAPATQTETPLVPPSPTIELTQTSSPTPFPNLTTTPATSTSAPADTTVPTFTATLANPGKPTLTPTLGILKYGTLPPAVPSAKIKIFNKSKAQAYISLQNYPPNKEPAILEYPVPKEVSVRAPLGYYLYVVWVGGRQIVGEFTLNKGDELTITIYKDRVEIR